MVYIHMWHVNKNIFKNILPIFIVKCENMEWLNDREASLFLRTELSSSTTFNED